MLDKREKIVRIEEKLAKVTDEIVAARVEIRRGYEAQMRLFPLKQEFEELYKELKTAEQELLTGTIVKTS